MWRRAASYLAKILRGAQPAELPVEQATHFEFALNLKTAKALGVELPTSTLLRADEVID
jgi:putative tryptophan/tyrosine transport system substrate-binding protein